MRYCIHYKDTLTNQIRVPASLKHGLIHLLVQCAMMTIYSSNSRNETLKRWPGEFKRRWFLQYFTQFTCWTANSFEIVFFKKNFLHGILRKYQYIWSYKCSKTLILLFSLRLKPIILISKTVLYSVSWYSRNVHVTFYNNKMVLIQDSTCHYYQQLEM